MIFVWTVEGIIQAIFVGLLVLCGLVYFGAIAADKIKAKLRAWRRG